MSIIEPLLIEDPERLTLFPIRYPEIWAAYKKAESTFWTAEEIHLEGDLRDWNERLNDDERHFISLVLSFFVRADNIVIENLAQRFCREVKIPEAQMFYNFQMTIEGIHSETYSLLIETYIKDSATKEKLLKGVNNYASIKAKARWAEKWITGNESFAERLLAFAIVEGIFFSGSFCAIYWLKKRGLMPGLSYSNDLISRDEGLHCDFALLLYSKLLGKLTQQRIEEMIREAVEVERSFIREALPVKLVGMNSAMMEEYLEYIADRLVVSLGLPKLYPKSHNPFDWMIAIGMNSKENMFEKPSVYSKAGFDSPSAKIPLTLGDEF